MLKQLGRVPHPHLISLLATFSLNNSWNMLFPLADCDLYTFWETNDGPLMGGSKTSTTDDMLWISTQITGLVSALTVIHNVGAAHHPDRPFGRHGDIKSDNVLCFPSCTHPRGILVLSDFGLSSSHRVNTANRKNTTTKTMAFTPAYRPPEYDIKFANKATSRRSDIWSLGCLLLEMICWILGGKDSLTKFHSFRTVVSAATGAASSVYFEAHQTEGENYEFSVKKEVRWVRQCFCSRWLHHCFLSNADLPSILQPCTTKLVLPRIYMTYSISLNRECYWWIQNKGLRRMSCFRGSNNVKSEQRQTQST